MEENRGNHKSKYRKHSVKFTYQKSSDYREVPLSVRLSIIFGGGTLIGLIIVLSGSGFIIPFFFESSVRGFIIFPLIFPFVGLFIMFFSIKKRIKYIQILKIGKLAYGTFLRSEATNVKINNNTVYRYFFEFTGEDGLNYVVSGDTHTSRLNDEATEALFYNPRNPNEAVLIDVLPLSVKSYINNVIGNEIIA